MSKSRNLSQLASSVDTSGVVLQAGGGTGIETVGAAGNVLTSNGTNWTSVVITSVGTLASLDVTNNVTALTFNGEAGNRQRTITTSR